MSLQADLRITLDRHLGAADAGQPAATRELAAALNQAIDAGERPAATSALRAAVVPYLDYTAVQSLHRVYRKLRKTGAIDGTPTRLAVLSSFTSEQLIQLVDLFLFAAGCAAEIYEADYGVFRQEIFDPGSGLYEFKPKIVFLATSRRDLGHSPAVTAGADDVRSQAEAEFQEWATLWKTAHDLLGCQILQNNFDAPPWRIFDNHEMSQPGSMSRHVARVNELFYDRAPTYVTIHDTDHLAASSGRWQWSDERFYHHAKLPCAPEYLVDYAHSVSSLIGAQLGLGKKCLVLDLDNTLWGGVIGDDGLDGIRLGQGQAEGEAYLSFQRYVKGLKARGVILAVCSKNEDHIAREVFEKHTEMVLRLEDISCFVANWGDKPANLRVIAKKLNIGLNSLVFVDDSPAERAIVRRLVPEVSVPEMPADVAGYIRALERHRYFQVVSVNAEDFQRTHMYLANAAREQAETSACGVADFLRSLQMTARIGPIDSATLERSTQLINRSNQFNLTTRRYSAAEVLAMAEDPAWTTRTVSLTDRFGDNGLISVLLARVDHDALVIDTWLMSCRVLKRGVEDLLLNHVFEIARAKGLRVIRGEYIPTPKNGLVREHYAKLGFTQTQTADNGHTGWELSVNDDWPGREVYMREIAPDGEPS